jgi:allantoinase
MCPMPDLLPGHDRYAYVPLPERPDYSWPGNTRLAFVVTTNIEWFAFGAGLGPDPAKTGEPQTHRNYAWRDYGNRIGIWRLLDLFDELELPAAHNTNSLVYRHAPQITDAIRRRGDEIVGHGRTNAENLRGLWPDDEARLLAEVTETIRRHEGKAPRGWMGAGAYETAKTPDILKSLGYRYLMDWPMDDQPVWMRTSAGPILSVPYPIETDDAQAIIHRKYTGRDFCDMLVAQFDEMLEQSRRHPLVMNVSVHPFVFGHPYQIHWLRQALQHCRSHAGTGRVWWTRPGEIADYCYSLPEETIPGYAFAEGASRGYHSASPSIS